MPAIPSPWDTSPDPDIQAFQPTPAPALFVPEVSSFALYFPTPARGDPMPAPGLPSGALPPGMERAVPKRKFEYVAGRLAAREALRCLGDQSGPWLARGEDRAPRWPTGRVGSITHTRGLAWAVAAPAAVRRGLGTDLEALVEDRSFDALSKLVLGDEERAAREHSPLGERAYMTLVFGAKECLFKCLYPTVQRFFGFDAARLLAVDAEAGEFRIRLLEDLHPELQPGAEWTGRFTLLEHRDPRDPDTPKQIMATGLAW